MNEKRRKAGSWILTAGLVAGLGAAPVSCSKKRPPADLVLLNGDVTTMEPAVPAARGLAVASVVLNVIVLVITLVTRAGIVGAVVGLVTSAGILVYLFGSANLRDRVQQYLRGARLPKGEWE